jgi:uncharacterized SAM-binding protein YcdF (DUF218 family)
VRATSSANETTPSLTIPDLPQGARFGDRDRSRPLADLQGYGCERPEGNAAQDKMDQEPEPLDPSTIEAVHRELLITTDLKRADLLFVFGIRHGVPEFLAVIEELWRRGLFSTALVTGGLTSGNERTEAEVLAEGMIAIGIPQARIMLEERATNTGENVVFSLPIIDRYLGLHNIRSLIAVGKYFTSARYLMTLQRHWPSVEKMLAPVHYHRHAPEDWPLEAESRAKVLREWRKLAAYEQAGFIAPWPS